MCEGSGALAMSRAQFLRLMGVAVTAPSVLTSTTAGATPRGPRCEAVLLDNVRGYTVTRDGLVRFGAMLIGDDGRIRALDPGEAGGAKRVDGGGRVCVPGLHDAHAHLWGLGAKAIRLDLSKTRTLAEAMAALRTYAAEHPALAWVRGRGWNEVIWGLGRLPTAADLDAVCADRPVFLTRVDGHAAVVNTAAMRIAGVTEQTPDPAGGKIVRGADGHPTGAFIDAAIGLVESGIPPVTEPEVWQFLEIAQRTANRVGLTSISDAGCDPLQLAVLVKAVEQDKLTVRVNEWLDWETFVKVGDAVRNDSLGDDMARVRTVKLYIDGALGSRGAAMIDPYTDAPDTRGLPQMTAAELNERVRRIIEAGYQCAVHAIGDLGNRMVLDAYDAALAGRSPEEKLRHRVEHVQVVAPVDIPRFLDHDLIASMQPVHATDDMNMAEARIGAARMAGAYAWRSFVDQGTMLAAGSDFPVSEESPFDGLHAAVTRTDREGKPVGGWYPEQSMTVVEAVRAFTLNAAYAAHQENILGSLEPGKHADFLLVDQDPFDLPTGRALWQTKVLQTWVGGRRVGEYGDL